MNNQWTDFYILNCNERRTILNLSARGMFRMQLITRKQYLKRRKRARRQLEQKVRFMAPLKLTAETTFPSESFAGNIPEGTVVVFPESTVNTGERVCFHCGGDIATNAGLCSSCAENERKHHE